MPRNGPNGPWPDFAGSSKIRPVPEPRPSAAPAAWLALGAVALLVVLLTIVTATVGSGRSEVATSGGGRITLDIPSGVAPDQTAGAPVTAAPATTPTTVRPTTTAPAAAPTTTATTARPTTTVPAGRTGGIYGQVVAADGSPMPGVCVRTDRQHTLDVVRTAADGTFLLGGVLPGATRVLLVDHGPGCAALSGAAVVADVVDVVADLWVPVLVTVG
jgi:hypothetical protein